jgi:hypothetical protein
VPPLARRERVRRSRLSPTKRWRRLGEAGSDHLADGQSPIADNIEERSDEEADSFSFRESGHHSMPDPRAPGGWNNLNGWIAWRRSNVVARQRARG